MNNTNEEKKKLVAISSRGVEILDDSLYKKVKRGNLSASMANSLLACPADWMLDKYILRDLEHEEQPHLERGTLFHSIMEAFFALPPGERSPMELGRLTKEVTQEKHPHLMTDEDAKTWVKNAVKGYLAMGFDFNSEVVPNITWKGKEQYGLELFVDGTIGNTKRKVVGYVDKIIESPNGLLIQDWKTGKTAHSWDPNKPNSGSFDYWRQQALYAMLMEKEGLEIGGASLIFPIANKVIDVDFKNPIVQNKVIEDMEKTDAMLNKCLADNFFPFTPDIFCTWCHLFYRGKKKGRPRFPKINQNELSLIVEYKD